MIEQAKPRMTVRIDVATTSEPDALVCGPAIDLDAVEVSHPVIVVEGLSPGIKSVDTEAKRVGYF
jgi:hypothetical protein